MDSRMQKTMAEKTQEGQEPQGNTMVPVVQHRYHLASRLACNMLKGEH